MPTYSYRCTQCSTAFDVQQAFTDDSLTECPSCQGRLRKIFSAVGVTFNGSGFYRTDSRAGASGGAGGNSGSEGTSGKADSAGGDSSGSRNTGDSGSSTPASTPSTTGATTSTAPSAAPAKS